jgi:hypothetical protein
LSIKRSALRRIDITANDVVSSLNTKRALEDRLLLRNPKAFRASGLTPFGLTTLGRQLGDTGDSPLDGSVLNGFFTRPNPTIRTFTSNLQRSPSLSDIPPAKISERTFSHAFGGLREKSSASPSGLYKAHYMSLVSKRNDCYPNSIRMIHVQLMEMPMTHGFAPERHQVRSDCPIFKKPGNFKTETLHFVHGVEATKNQTLKIGVA